MEGVGFNRPWSCVVISSAAQWAEVDGKFLESIGELRMIGLDCEWVEAVNFDHKEEREQRRLRYVDYSDPTLLDDDEADAIRIENGSNGKVALLQLASHNGMVVLIRLCFFKELPQSLRDLLMNCEILKLGVNIEVDVKKLFQDWDVVTNGFVDIRNIVVRNRRFLEDYHKRGLGLKKLCDFLTGSNFEESFDIMIRCSHWAAKKLSAEQIEYARNDAIAAIEGVYCFATKYMDNLPDPSSCIDGFAEIVRKAFYADANRPCTDHVARILEHRREAAAVHAKETDAEKSAAIRKAEERRRRREANTPIDATAESELEFDYERWRKSDHYRKFQIREGMERAVVFKDAEGTSLAAIDGTLLNALNKTELEGQQQKLCFSVKNARGDVVYETYIELEKLNIE